jgi:Protein of unknown function (DUF3137)
MTYVDDSGEDAGLNPLEGAGFDKLYASDIEPELTRLETNRRKAMRTFLIIVGIGVVLAALESVGGWDFRLVMATLAVAGVIAIIPLEKVREASKQAVISAICAPLQITYVEKNFEPPAWNSFLSLNLVPKPTSTAFEDHFSGAHAGIAFALCEATVTQGSGKEAHTVFHGQIFQLITQRKLYGTTVILRDPGWLDRFQCPTGMKKVGLEDPNFEKVFEVYGTDQVEAREILTPTFMQELVDLETSYAGQHLRCGFVGSDVLIAMEGPDRFEVGAMFSTLINKARVEGVAHDIEAIFSLIGAFNKR